MSLDDLHAKPGHLIRRCQQIAVGLFIEEATALGHDVTPVQYAAMTAIAAHPGIDATRLSELIAFDRSTLGNVIERLEAKGWVERRPGDEDRRTKLLRLTEAGAGLLARIEPAVARAQERILAPLPPDERRAFVRMLGRIVDINNDHSRVPMGPRPRG
jgi:DNA-binding MarR family transcriptional regulator